MHGISTSKKECIKSRDRIIPFPDQVFYTEKGGMIFPDKCDLFITAIEDAQYKVRWKWVIQMTHKCLLINILGRENSLVGWCV